MYFKSNHQLHVSSVYSTIGDESFRKKTFEDYVSHLKEQAKRIKQNKKVMVVLCLRKKFARVEHLTSFGAIITTC